MRKPMVVHLIERLDVGGAEVTILQLIMHLRGGKYEPLVCALSGGPLKGQIEDRGIQVITLNISRRSIALFPLFAVDLMKIMTALIFLVLRRNVDIIHTHLPHCAILGGVLGKLTRVQVVASFPGPRLFPLDRKKHDFRNYLLMIFYRLSGKLVNRFIAVSGDIKDVLCKTVRVEPRKITVINSGVNVGDYEQPVDIGAVYGKLGLSSDDAVIACVARLSPEKGHKILIMAAQEVVRSHPNAKFLLVGEGPMLAQLKTLASQLNLENHVKFLGYLADIASILAAATSFVLPSFEEGISVALLEAMAAGKPVVATAVPGTTDVVIPDETGILVPAGDSTAMAQALSYLLTNCSIAQRMGAKGKERIKNYFDFRKTAHMTEQVYDELMKERQDRRADHWI